MVIAVNVTLTGTGATDGFNRHHRWRHQPDHRQLQRGRRPSSIGRHHRRRVPHGLRLRRVEPGGDDHPRQHQYVDLQQLRHPERGRHRRYLQRPGRTSRSSTLNASAAGADSFVFSNGAIPTGSIDGKGGNDTLNLGAVHQWRQRGPDLRHRRHRRLQRHHLRRAPTRSPAASATSTASPTAAPAGGTLTGFSTSVQEPGRHHHLRQHQHVDLQQLRYPDCWQRHRATPSTSSPQTRPQLRMAAPGAGSTSCSATARS